MIKLSNGIVGLHFLQILLEVLFLGVFRGTPGNISRSHVVVVVAVSAGIHGDVV